MAAEDANLRNWRFGTLGDLAARVRNYASRGRESANYGGAILLGLTALEWEEGAQHPAHWRCVTLYHIVSHTVIVLREEVSHHKNEIQRSNSPIDEICCVG